jgi:hypothetical protein
MKTRAELLESMLSQMRSNVTRYIEETGGADRSEYLSKVVRQGAQLISRSPSITNLDLLQMAQACIHFAIEMELAHGRGDHGMTKAEREQPS